MSDTHPNHRSKDPRTGKTVTLGRKRSSGQSSVLGVALLIGIIVLSSTTILYMSVDVIQSQQQQVQTETVSYSFSNLDAAISESLAGGPQKTYRADLGYMSGGNGYTVDSGQMKVKLVSTDTGKTTVIANRELGGAIFKTDNGKQVAYQGGGIWRIGPSGGASVVSPPPFNYEGNTLTLPIIQVTDDSKLSPRYTSVTRTSTTKIYPDESKGYTNPATDKKVVVTVKSEYYRAWGEYFEQKANTKVEYDKSKNIVKVTLITPYNNKKMDNAAVSAGTVVIQAKGGGTFTDSYNSENGAYSSSTSGEGDILARGDVKLQGSATLEGDIESGGSVTLSGGSKVDGNVRYVENFNCQGGCDVTGYVKDNAEVDNLQPVNSLISDKISEIKSSNDNDQVAALTANGKWKKSAEGGTITLPAGTYYVTESPSSGTTIKFDTSSGDVVIASDQKKVDWDGNTLKPVNTEPDNMVRIYTNADSISMSNAKVGDRLTDNSPWFRVYGKSGLDVTINDGGKFVGLLYSPSKDASKGTVTIKGPKTEVFGGIVGGGNRMEILSGATIHFDKSLTDERAVIASTNTIPRITYLHITAHKVELGNN